MLQLSEEVGIPIAENWRNCAARCGMWHGATLRLLRLKSFLAYSRRTAVAGESHIWDRLILDWLLRDIPEIKYPLISAWVLFWVELVGAVQNRGREWAKQWWLRAETSIIQVFVLDLFYFGRWLYTLDCKCRVRCGTEAVFFAKNASVNVCIWTLKPGWGERLGLFTW